MEQQRLDPMSATRASGQSRRGMVKGLTGAVLGLGLLGRASAQEGTPATAPPAGTEIAPGVIAEVLAAAPSDRAPGQTVYVARFTFQPGAEIFPHSHPGTTVDAVGAGTWGWTLVAGTARVVRGAASNAPMPAEDLTELGAEVILEVGDAISYEADVIHTARGAGAEPVVIHSSQLLTAGAARMMTDHMDMATPEG